MTYPADPLPGFSAIWRMMREPRSRWPRDIPVVQQRPPAPAPGRVAATFIGHATFLLQTPSGAILTDPFFSDRASPLSWIGPRRSRAPGVKLEDLPDIALLLLSHNHYDHCDLPALRRLAKRHDPVCLTPSGNARLLRRAGFEQVRELAWWDATTAGGFAVTCVPARHFSGRTPWDRNRALWGAFGIRVDGRHILFAADSGYGPHFTQMRERLGTPDLALIPIGAYEPRWFMQPIHMNPEEAVQAHTDLGSTRSIAMHHATLQLTPEAIDAPAEGLVAARTARGLEPDEFVVLQAGESLTI